MGELAQLERRASAQAFLAGAGQLQDAEPFDPDHEKECVLWRRVLVESINDYLFKRCTSVDFKDAQEWFFGRVPSVTSFERVCDLLGHDPNALRAKLAGLHTVRATRPDRIAEVMRLLNECGIRRFG